MAELEWDWEADVLQNLNRFLGVDLRYVLGIPPNVAAGDRVLYMLKGGSKAAQELCERIAARWQVSEDVKERKGPLRFDSLGSLNLGCPPPKVELRITDLLGDLCFWRGQRSYLQSGSLLPSENWPVLWALGAIFLADRRLLVYGDFRQPRVKLLFTEPFFVAGDEEEAQSRRVARLLERLQGALTVKNRYVRHESYQWAKIVNASDGAQWLALMNQQNRLTTEQIPYPDSG